MSKAPAGPTRRNPLNVSVRSKHSVWRSLHPCVLMWWSIAPTIMDWSGIQRSLLTAWVRSVTNVSLWGVSELPNPKLITNLLVLSSISVKERLFEWFTAVEKFKTYRSCQFGTIPAYHAGLHRLATLLKTGCKRSVNFFPQNLERTPYL